MSSALHQRGAIAPLLDRIRDQQDQKHVFVLGKKYPAFFFAQHLTKAPGVFMLFSLVIPVVLSLMFLSTDTRFDSAIKNFKNPLHESIRSLENVQAAKEHWAALQRQGAPIQLSQKQFNQSAPLGARQGIAYRFTIQYKTRFSFIQRLNNLTMSNISEQANLFREHGVYFARVAEADVADLPSYKRLCWNSKLKNGMDRSADGVDFPRCAPMNSLTTYFYPGNFTNLASGGLDFQFSGDSNVFAAPDILVADAFFANPQYRWFVNQAFSPTRRESHIIRTQITLGTPLDDGTEVGSYAYELAVDNFIIDLRNSLNKWKHVDFELSIGSPRLSEGFVADALRWDLSNLFPACAIIVLIFMWYHAKSKFIAIMTVLQLLLTIWSTLFMFVEDGELPLMSLLLILIAIAFGCDGAMMINTTFNHSGIMATTGRSNNLSLPQRISFTIRQALLPIYMSNIMAIVAFACIALSPIPAIHSFAGTASAMLVVNMYMFTFFYPPLLLVYHYNFSVHRRNLQRQHDVLARVGSLKRDPCLDAALQDVSVQRQLQKKMDFVELRKAAAHRRFSNDVVGITGFKKAADIVASGFAEELSQFGPSRETNDENDKNSKNINSGQATKVNVSIEDFPEASAVNLRSRGSIEEMNRRRVNTERLIHVPREMCTPNEVSWTKTTAVLAEVDQSSTAMLNSLDIPPAVNEGAISPTPVCTEADSTRYSTQWRNVASKLDFAGNLSHSVIPFMAQSFCTVIMGGAILVSGSERLSPRRTATAATVGAARRVNLEEQQFFTKLFRKHITAKLHLWSDAHGKDIERQYCCGFIGKRVGESRTEKDMRILAKTVRKNPYSTLERFFYNHWAPFIHTLRYGFVALAMALIIAFAVFSSRLTPTLEDVKLAAEPPLLERFFAVQDGFAEQGDCDYCGAYFRPLTEFRKMDQKAIQMCMQKNFQPQMFVRADNCQACAVAPYPSWYICGVCAGEGLNQRTLDNCRQCLHPTSAFRNSCTDCDLYDRENSQLCWPCFRNEARFYYAGAKCAIYCHDFRNCIHGVCNGYTGECVCHQSYSDGFWQDNPDDLLLDPPQHCTMCLPEFAADINGKQCMTPCPGSTCRCDNQFYIGVGCTQIWTAKCKHGTPTRTNSSCGCDAGWGGIACDKSVRCSSRGVYHEANVVPQGFAGCKCDGQFFGPACQFCRCYNGGYCDDNGQCVCFDAWAGHDCNACPLSCRDGGECPETWLPAMYPEKTCRSLFCLGENSCPECAHKTCNDLVGNTTSLIPTCNSNPVCDFDNDTKTCMGIIASSTPTKTHRFCTKCKGFLSGIRCEDCDNRFKLQCSRDGWLVGCDGKQATLNKRPMAYDGCGVCGGSRNCLGCDGELSFKQFDQCGICGGYSECSLTGEHFVPPTVRFTVMFGVIGDPSKNKLSGIPYGTASLDPSLILSETGIQQFLFDVCFALLSFPDSRRASSSCVFEDFVNWLKKSATIVRYGDLGGRSFPIPPTRQIFDVEQNATITIDQLMYRFALDNARLGDIGFTSARDTDRGFKVAWFKAELRTGASTSLSPSKLTAKQEELNQWIVQYFARSQTRTPVTGAVPWVITSEITTRAYSRIQAAKGTSFSIVLSLVLYFALSLPFSCSLTVAAMGTICIGGVVTCTMGTAYLAGFDVGPIEQISMVTVVGFASQHTVHVMLGYVGFLHGTRSNLFAMKLTRLETFRGTLLRTGLPIFLSAITLIFSTVPFLFARAVVFRRVAIIMVIASCFSLLWSLVLFGALLCTIGPVVSYRHPGVSALLFLIEIVIAAIVLLIIFFSGGIEGPGGEQIIAFEG